MTTPYNNFYLAHHSTTAGSQRLALSGLQSRLHTIRKYTFPPSSAEAAAAELVRLYVQKGHNHHACHRFLKKRRNRRLVGVHPWTKGFVQPIHLPRVPPPIHKQGRQARYTYLTQRSSGVSRDGWTDHPPVPASTVEQAVPILLFDSMVVHDTSPKPFHFLTQLNCTEARHRTPVETLFNNTVLLTHAPFRSLTFLPSVGTESLKTNVRVSVQLRL